ncbi:hypothetical protein GCM10027444_03250 [Actinopolyspora lacussalsi]
MSSGGSGNDIPAVRPALECPPAPPCVHGTVENEKCSDQPSANALPGLTVLTAREPARDPAER